jgi:DNA-binding NarL/FixJ family response regulator
MSDTLRWRSLSEGDSNTKSDTCYTHPKGDRIFQLIVIDDDPIFRLGLRAALETFPDLRVVAEADTAATALERLAELAGAEKAVDLVLLELSLGRSSPNRTSDVTSPLEGLQLCQQLKAQYPNLPILLLSSPPTPLHLVAARQAGVNGYCPKGTEISVVVQAMRHLISGNPYWAVETLPVTSGLASQSPGYLLTWRQRLRQSGLQQIDDALAEVTSLLQNPQLSTLDWFFWSGRRRELLTARWLVNQLLPADIIIMQPLPNSFGGGEESGVARAGRTRTLKKSESPSGSLPLSNQPSLPPTLGTTTSSPQPSTSSQQSDLFEAAIAKLQLGIQNLSGSFLEIDILREEKRRELLYIILRQLEDVLDELRFSQVQADQLADKLPLVVRDLWQASITIFFGKYYTLLVGNREYEVANVLLQDAAIVQSAILDKIPLVVDLFAHLLFQTPIVIDNAVYATGTAQAMERAEALLENLIVQVANAAIQPLLNNFPDVEIIKQSFYDRRFISTREIANFRNNLSWKYRIEQYVTEPRAIFESRYNLLVLNSRGIKKISIYAPRRRELEQLTGIQLAVTLILETRDAIAPRMRAVVSFLGTGVIYVLTQVIGRGIGLIGRGIIQGIGSTLQETRFGKNSDRQK